MSTSVETRSEGQRPANVPASIVWFEMPADDVERARRFYHELFGWKIEKFPEPTVKPCWHIDTAGEESSPDGGMIERQHPDHHTINYISVVSVDESAVKARKWGGQMCMTKTAVPQMGCFVVCQDTEKNMFALWESNEGAR